MQTVKERPGTKEKSTQKSPTGKSSRKYVASAVIAFALFIVTNIALFTIFGPVKTYGNDLWNGTGSIDLAIEDFKKLESKPDVVLLGSSLMMYPFWSMDFNRDQSIGDLFHHHRSSTLENKLSKDGAVNKPTVFSWAIFGQMASDSYIYANEFLKGDKKPRMVIWGIAPRDFSDAELSSPMNTISFQRLVNLNNFSEYGDIYLPTFQDKADFIISKSVFLYGRRWHIQKEINKGADKVRMWTNPSAPVSENKPGFEKDAGGFKFTGGREEIWEHSTLEYQKRYKNIDIEKLRIQLGFMKRMLSLLNERGVQVMIVNMPLTETNRELMPQGFYDSFRQEVARIAKEEGAVFEDHGADGDISNSDFWDTAHMSYQGGYKLLDKITPTIEGMLSKTETAQSRP